MASKTKTPRRKSLRRNAEVGALLFTGFTDSTPRAGFSTVRKEHTELFWEVAAAEQRIYRACGFSD